MSRPTNPYIVGDPVGYTPNFVGREDIYTEVVNYLSRPNQNSITLFGQRRIGKTSLLQMLKKRLADDPRFLPVDFDLQDKSDWELSRLLKSLSDALTKELKWNGEYALDDNGDSFKGWLHNALEEIPEGSSLILLFDEFDSLADPHARSVTREFLPYLRNLLSLDPTRLKFIFVLGRNIHDLSATALSIFKTAHARRVSMLSQVDTEELVNLSVKNKTLTWEKSALKRVWQLTNGHPFLTQMLCSVVWEVAHRSITDHLPIVSAEIVEESIEPSLEASRASLEWLWNGMGPAEKLVTSALAEAGSNTVSDLALAEILTKAGVRLLIRELQNAPELLVEWDVLIKVEDGYRFKIELLRSWVAKYHPVARTFEELDRIQPAANAQFLAAERYYNIGDLNNSETFVNQAISLNPNHQNAQILLAEILIAQNNLAKAEKLLSELMETSPNNARHRLVQVLKMQIETGRVNNPVPILERILEIDPTNSDAKAKLEEIEIVRETEQIRRLESSNNLFEAQKLAKLLVEKFPQGHDGQMYLSDSLKKIELQLDIREKLEEAKFLVKKQHSEAAVGLIASVIQVDPQNVEAITLLHQIVVLPKNAPSGEQGSGQAMKSVVPSVDIQTKGFDRPVSKLQERSDHKRKIFQNRAQEISANLDVRNPLHQLQTVFWAIANPSGLSQVAQIHGAEQIASMMCQGVGVVMLVPLTVMATITYRSPLIAEEFRRVAIWLPLLYFVANLTYLNKNIVMSWVGEFLRTVVVGAIGVGVYFAAIRPGNGVLIGAIVLALLQHVLLSSVPFMSVGIMNVFPNEAFGRTAELSIIPQILIVSSIAGHFLVAFFALAPLSVLISIIHSLRGTAEWLGNLFGSLGVSFVLAILLMILPASNFSLGLDAWGVAFRAVWIIGGFIFIVVFLFIVNFALGVSMQVFLKDIQKRLGIAISVMLLALVLGSIYLAGIG